jgi:hypothetical protein
LLRLLEASNKAKTILGNVQKGLAEDGSDIRTLGKCGEVLACQLFFSMSGVLEPGKVRQSGPQRGWVDPNFDHKELEPRAHAKKLLKITQQWKAAAEEGGIPPHDRFVGFLEAVTSLTTRMRDSEILQELGRIRALLSEHDRKHSDMISKMQHYRCPSYEDPSNRQTRQCPPDPRPHIDLTSVGRDGKLDADQISL